MNVYDQGAGYRGFTVLPQLMMGMAVQWA